MYRKVKEDYIDRMVRIKMKRKDWGMVMKEGNKVIEDR